jgi:hypothetical protein
MIICFDSYYRPGTCSGRRWRRFVTPTGVSTNCCYSLARIHVARLHAAASYIGVANVLCVEFKRTKCGMLRVYKMYMILTSYLCGCLTLHRRGFRRLDLLRPNTLPQHLHKARHCRLGYRKLPGNVSWLSEAHSCGCTKVTFIHYSSGILSAENPFRFVLDLFMS